MACRYLLGSYPSSSLSLKTPPHKYRPRSSSITPQLSTSDDEDEDKPNSKPNFDFLKLSVTLTVISASLPQPSRAAPVKEKKRVPKKSAPKKPEGLTPQELKSWSQGLPVVSNRIPYTRLLELHNSGDLKHIIKPAGAELRGRDEPVLAVLGDSTVKRTVLPSVGSDRKFWEEWEKQALDSLCVNAYAPPLKKPELPRPYLSFLARVPAMLAPLIRKRKPRKESRRAAELRLEMERFRAERKADEERRQREAETMQKTMKARKKEEERRMRLEARKQKQKASLIAAKRSSERMANVWSNLARDQNFTTLLGLVFFYIFYRTVVYNYKKQKKDYDDRLKIEQAEAEERKKMKELERMEGIDVAEDDEQFDPETGETNNYMKMAKQFMKSGARVRRASSKNSKGNPQYMERDVDVKFTDVAGLGKIRYELEEIVKFFTEGEVYRRRGVKIPGGILLCGPPGVGKTLLAKAVAGEAGVNFFSISASQFVEIYVGVGASRVRALYKEARENAPSVVFIDELDAVGRARGLIKGSGGKERDATLNQLLVSLDGFEGRGEVITIASTNRPDILDPALVRPGRFDRKIYIPKPGRIGRVEILKVHARNKPMAEDVDYMAVASSTDGMVGAELANIVEVAAMNMMRDGRTEITTDDLLQAAQMEERGMLDIKNRSFDTWKKIAINEAALAVVAANFPDLKNIEFVTIAPRAGRELGYVRMKLDPIKFHEGLLTRQSLLDYITYKLAPRAADELWFGEGQLSTIWAETADTARSTARTYVLGGLSEKNYGLSNFWVADRLNDLDVEALQILNMCYERAKEILERNRKLMDAVVDELVQKKSLTKQEFADLVELHGSLEHLPPSILDIRIAKRKQFQDRMMNQKELVSGSNL